jgi:ribosome-binding ATPase YchF (GTP1/OBG family)
MQVGLVGKPSSGKSSFFKALTMADVQIADFPFTTIEPNIGVGYVTKECVCKKLNVKCNPKNSICENGIRKIPVKLIDVAGLVPGAHTGKGMGNQFLDDLSRASCLIHIVDVSGTTDSEGKATKDHDPSKDVEFLEKEIDLWFVGIIEKATAKFRKKMKFTKGADLVEILAEQLTGLGIKKQDIMECLDKFDPEKLDEFATEIRKETKPIIIAANKIDLETSEKKYQDLKKHFKNLTIIPTSAAAEIALKTAQKNSLIKYENNKIDVLEKLPENQKKGLIFIEKDIIKKYGSTGIQSCLNKAVFDVLDYITVYPVADINKMADKKGNVLPDVFLMKKGSTLKDLAYAVHSTMAEKFIGGIEVEKKMKLGADYKLKDNDVIQILFSKR